MAINLLGDEGHVSVESGSITLCTIDILSYCSAKITGTNHILGLQNLCSIETNMPVFIAGFSKFCGYLSMIGYLLNARQEGIGSGATVGCGES